MKEVQKASFSFESYKILKFNYVDPLVEVDTISFKINPSGKYFEKKGQFNSQFEFIVNYGEENENELLSATMLAVFDFGEELEYERLPSFFFNNSIAIAFPYLRAFVSTLTSLANVKPLIMGLLNLSSLEDIYKENTIIEK